MPFSIEEHNKTSINPITVPLGLGEKFFLVLNLAISLTINLLRMALGMFQHCAFASCLDMWPISSWLVIRGTEQKSNKKKPL